MKNSKILCSAAVIALLVVSCKKEVIVNPNSSKKTASMSEVESSANAEKVQTDLPVPARDFLKQHYDNVGVAKYEVKDVPIVGKTSEVKLVNGVEVDFDSEGQWLEIKDPKGVKEAVLLPSVADYVKTNYKGVHVTSVDKEDKILKVELSNDIDLEFDQTGKFIRVKP